MDLLQAIANHRVTFNRDPELLIINPSFQRVHLQFFRGKLHILCCGKGAIFSGIPVLLLNSPMVPAFFICY